jgi:predicted nucleic acid-binding protein
VLPLLSVQWGTEPDHDSAMATLLAANRRDLSLVDCVSFAAMRRLGVSRAFTLDDHFREQGFECLPI